MTNTEAQDDIEQLESDENEPKFKAFKLWLKEQGNSDTHVQMISDTEFSSDDDEYLVLTDEEADAQAKDYILDSVWAFKKSFLDAHSDTISELDDKSFAHIQELCEGANKMILAMIDDKDHFVDDAILSDGRGNFLSGYDGEENEIESDGTWYFIYRTN